MFKKATKKLADNIIIDAKETIKKEMNSSLEKRMPVILGVVTIIAMLACMIEPRKIKPDFSTITINNYYYK